MEKGSDCLSQFWATFGVNYEGMMQRGEIGKLWLFGLLYFTVLFCFIVIAKYSTPSKPYQRTLKNSAVTVFVIVLVGWTFFAAKALLTLVFCNF